MKPHRLGVLFAFAIGAFALSPVPVAHAGRSAPTAAMWHPPPIHYPVPRPPPPRPRPEPGR
jgi:hypothetical protein